MRSKPRIPLQIFYESIRELTVWPGFGRRTYALLEEKLDEEEENMPDPGEQHYPSERREAPSVRVIPLALSIFICI